MPYEVYRHRRSLQSRIVFSLLAGVDKPMAGHAVLYVMDELREGRETGDRTGNVQDVWVRADLRGKGFGRQLMEAVHLHARRLGLRSLTLTSNRKRKKARGLYRSLGYVQSTDGFRLDLRGAADEA